MKDYLHSLPEIEADFDVSPGTRQSLHAMLYDRELLGVGMQFRSPDRDGRQTFFRASSVVLEDVVEQGQGGFWTSPCGRTLRVALLAEDGTSVPIGSCLSQPRPEPVSGVILTGPDYRTWFYEDGHDGDPVEVSSDIPALIEASIAEAGHTLPSFEEDIALVGSFRLSPFLGLSMLMGVEALESHPMGAEALDTPRLDACVADIVARAKRGWALQNHVCLDLSPDRLVSAIKAGGVLETGRLIPDMHDFKNRRRFDEAVEAMSISFMARLRDKGYLAPCPNNGPRRVREMAAWNAFLAGDPDGPDDELTFKAKRQRQALSRSPAFSAIRGAFFRESVNLERTLNAEDRPLGPNDVDEAAFSIHSRLLDTFCKEGGPDTMLDTHMESGADGTRVCLQGSFLKPVLASIHEMDHLGRLRPLPLLDEAKPLRHFTLPLPSGRLVMSDWIRVEGFKEGLEALCGDDDRQSLNTEAGLDERARSYFEKAGVVIVQVGNTSPYAFRETLPSGQPLWRMGHVDEDDKRFWNEDGISTGEVVPSPEWRTCTDLWANIFADREIVLDVLMASERYETRFDAADTLDAWLSDSVSVEIDTGLSELQVYTPTGATIHAGDFNAVFQADEIEKAPWREDAYVLSAEHLTVDPDLFEDETWEFEAPGNTVCDDFQP